MTSNFQSLIKKYYPSKIKVINLIKYEIDWILYDDGAHLKKGKRRGGLFRISDFILIFKFFKNLFNRKKYKNNILSFVPYNFDDTIEYLGYNPYSIIYSSRKNSHNVFSLYMLINFFKILKIFRKNSLNQIIFRKINFLETYVNKFEIAIKKNNFSYLFLMSDQDFFSRVCIQLFRKLNKKSFIFSHGLPGIYNKNVDNMSDYLLVWGDKIKSNYIKAGFNGDKIKVIGSPRFDSTYFEDITISWSDNKILVIPESSVRWVQYDDEPRIIDRNRMLLYLYKVEQVLKKNGYKHCYCRPHPSINIKWLAENINTDFYSIENRPFSKIKFEYDLVIGATSTVFLEFILHNTNYLVFEDRINDLYPPFDGSDHRVKCAFNELELHEAIKKKSCQSSDFIKDYIRPFDLKILKSLIDE